METRLVKIAPKTPYFEEMKSWKMQFWPIFIGGSIMEDF